MNQQPLNHDNQPMKRYCLSRDFGCRNLNDGDEAELSANHAILDELCERTQRVSGYSMRQIESVDRCLSRLNELGLFHPTIVLGPIVFSRSYGVRFERDCYQLVQAALSTNCGIAAVFWDSEEYAELAPRDPERHSLYEMEAAAYEKSHRLADCEYGVQLLVASHVDTMLGEFVRRCNLHPLAGRK